MADGTSTVADGLAARGGRVAHTYYPVALLKLTVRLEDFTNEDGPRAVAQGAPVASQASALAKAAAAAKVDIDVLRALGEDVTETAGEAAALEAQAKAPPSGDQAPPNNVPPDPLTFTIPVVPLDAKVELNSFRIADKLQASFALQDLPLAPEIVRSMMVEAYIGTARAEDFGVPDRWIPSLLDPKFSLPMFRGYVDTADMEAGEDFQVSIQARSLEAVLMDGKINPRSKERRIRRTDSYRDPTTGKVIRGEKITSYVKRLLSTVPEFAGAKGGSLGVRIFPNYDAAKEPILSADIFLRSLQTAESRATAGGGPVQAAPPDVPGADPAAQVGAGTPVVPAATAGEMSPWDVIVRACELCGLLPTYDPSFLIRDDATGTVIRSADVILLVPPQTVKETPQEGLTIPGGARDGFERELTIGGAGAPLRTQVRFLVWGHNLKKMKTSRKFGQVKAPAVRVVSYNPDAAPDQRVVSAQFPKTMRGVHASAAGTGQGGTKTGHPPTNEVVTKVVQGIRDVRILEQIAVAAYHSISRHEVSVEIDTDEMSSYIDPTRPESHNENPDLLRLRPGSPCRVVVARRVVDPVNGDLAVDALSRLFDRRFDADFLRRALLGGSTGSALSARGRENVEATLQKIEDAYTRSRLTDWFFCRTVNHSWSVTDGYSCSMELANFVEARNLPANLSTQDKKTNDQKKLLVADRKTDVGSAQAILDDAAREVQVDLALRGR